MCGIVKDEIKNMKKAIVLAGTPPHATLIKKLKALGYYTILIDYYPHPYAADFADKHIRESTLDKEKVLQIAKAEKVDLVITTCMDHANVTACYVSEQLGLSHPYSYETALTVTDKVIMKQIMRMNGIPTSDFYVIHEVNEAFPIQVPYPLIIKPTDRNGSKGVHRADSEDEVKKFVEEALNTSFSHSAIIEGFNNGDEIQVDCFATDNGADILMTRIKQKINNKDNKSVQQSLGSIFPAPLDEKELQQAKDIANDIARSFQLKNTPFFYQANLTSNGIKVIEFAARVAGGLSYFVLKKITGFDPIDGALLSWIGEPVLPVVKEPQKMYSTNLIYMNAGVFSHIQGFEEMKNEGVITDSFCFLHKGDVINSDLQSGNRVGAFIVEANDKNDLYSKMKRAVDHIDIIDMDGNKKMRKDFYNL